MNLSESRFYKSDATFRLNDNTLTTATVYSYETHNALYDVLVFPDGFKAYRTNCGPATSRIDACHRIHYEIEHHFGI